MFAMSTRTTGSWQPSATQLGRGSCTSTREVAEWTSSLFAPGIRVVKGGSFAKTPEPVRLASREPVDQAQFRAAPERYGFRLAFRR